MQRMVACLIAGLGLLALPRPADACGVVSFEGLGRISPNFNGELTPISGPVVAVSGGVSTDGKDGALTAGWMWGDRQVGGLFPGIGVRRVLVEAQRTPDQTAFAMTFGWQDTGLIPAALDLGLGVWIPDRDDAPVFRMTEGVVDSAPAGGIGPLARLTIGERVGVRLTGGMQVTGDAHFVGAAELVVDITAIARHR